MSQLITLLIASRGRPKQFKKARDSAFKNAGTDIKFMSYIDSDDEKKDEYEDVYIGPPVNSAKALLFMLEQVETPFFMIGSDDVEFQTKDWDRKFLNAMPPDHLAVIYGSDHAKQNCNHFLSSMKWHRLVGMWPNVFEHFGPDGWVSEVAKKCNRLIKVPDVVVEHFHFKYGKSPIDETYIRTRHNGAGAHSNKIIASGREQQEKDAQTILKAIDDFNKRGS